MDGSPCDVSENAVTQEKRKKGWRISCDVGEATEAELILQALSLHLRHSSFSNPSLPLPTSQLILKLFRSFTYVTAHSPTPLSLLVRHRIFTYVTWRAAHGPQTDEYGFG